jgi:hypothetical protein
MTIAGRTFTADRLYRQISEQSLNGHLTAQAMQLSLPVRRLPDWAIAPGKKISGPDSAAILLLTQ